MAFKKYYISGIVCLLIGVGLIIIGTFVISNELPKQKRDTLVIDSEKSPQYKDWAGGYDKENEYQQVFYFYNLTNADDVRMNGDIPEYTTVGPYVYRRYRKSENVTFPDNGNQIQFLDFRDYYYDSTASWNNSKLDYITNINPVYVAAISQAEFEQNMLVGATGGYLTNFTNYLTGPFISLYVSYMFPSYFPVIMNEQIAVINNSLHDTQSSTDYFITAWCNGTSKSNLTGNWTGLLLSYSGEPTGISWYSAQLLLDPNTNLSLLNQDNYTTWAWDRAGTNSTYSALLQQQFNITNTQVQAIWNWRANLFAPTFLYPDALLTYNLTDISDLGWAQWTAGYGILGGSIYDPVSIFTRWGPWADEIGYFIQIELFIGPNFFDYGISIPFGNWSFAKQAFNPTTGLSNVTNFQAFAMLASFQNSSADYSPWGLNMTQANQLYGYATVIGLVQVPTALQLIYGPSGGLMLTQTVDDWVFNCNTFLMDLLLPDPQPCSLLNNHTVFANVTIYSGKNNITQINQYVSWQGSPVIGVWQEPVPIIGCTELGQFQPDQTSSTMLQTFNDEFARTMTLNWNGSTSVRNINTNQFLLNYNDVFSPNPLYFNTIPGFANMTSFKLAPLFYSLWDMYNVDDSIKQQVIGIGNSSEFEASTIVQVEPITGNTLQVWKRLQANVYVYPNCSWCTGLPMGSMFGNSNLTANTFYPLVKGGEFSQISEALAAKVRVQIWALKSGSHVGLIVGLSAGIPLMVLGVVLFVCGAYKSKRNSYTPLG